MCFFQKGKKKVKLRLIGVHTNLLYFSLDCRKKTEYMTKTHRVTWRAFSLHAGESSAPQPFRWEVTVLTTAPQRNTTLKKVGGIFRFFCLFSLSLNHGFIFLICCKIPKYVGKQICIWGSNWEINFMFKTKYYIVRKLQLIKWIISAHFQLRVIVSGFHLSSCAWLSFK